jgi:hypothetical protein
VSLPLCERCRQSAEVEREEEGFSLRLLRFHLFFFLLSLASVLLSAPTGLPHVRRLLPLSLPHFEHSRSFSVSVFFFFLRVCECVRCAAFHGGVLQRPPLSLLYSCLVPCSCGCMFTCVFVRVCWLVFMGEPSFSSVAIHLLRNSIQVIVFSKKREIKSCALLTAATFSVLSFAQSRH